MRKDNKKILKKNNHHPDSQKIDENTRLNFSCRYTGTDDRTNVVIMKVKMVTGWIPQQILDVSLF